MKILAKIAFIFIVCGMIAFVLVLANEGRKVGLILFIVTAIALIGTASILIQEYSSKRTEKDKG